MIYWMKPLPPAEIDREKFHPFIRNDWLRNHYMYFVYGLMALLLVLGIAAGAGRELSLWMRLQLVIPVFLIHELLHFLVVFRRGNVSITHSGLYFWMNTDARMSKGRYWLFMSLPLMMLTGLPAVLSLVCAGRAAVYLSYIAWLNAVIAGSDIINCVLILLKPRHSEFYRGYDRVAG